MVALLELLQLVLVEVLARPHQILFQSDLAATQVGVASTEQHDTKLLQMLVELQLGGRHVVHSEVDDDDGEVALEAT